MAAPLLHVRVPADVPPPPPDEAAGGGGAANGHAPHAGAESGSESSSGLDTPRGAGGALGCAAGGEVGKGWWSYAHVRCATSAQVKIA